MSIPQPIFQETTIPGFLGSATFPGPAVIMMIFLNPNAVLCPFPADMWRSAMLTSTNSDSCLTSFILSSPQSSPTWRSNWTVATATGIPWEQSGSVKAGTFVSFEIMDLFSNMVCKSWTSIEKTALCKPLSRRSTSISTFPLSRFKGNPKSWFLVASNDSHLGSPVFPCSKT